MSARALYDRWQQALDFAVGEKHTASWEESPLKAAKIVSETFPTIQNEWIYGFLDWVEREAFRGKSLEEPEEDQARMLDRRCICGLEESLPQWKRFVFRYIKMLG